MANIFFTFDYEVFFGSRTGTTEKCLLEPTRKLIRLAAKHQAKFTFFVDVLYLMRLRYYSTMPELKNDYDNILSQLRTLVNDGHDIQLHLHPHWIKASYDGIWKLDYSNYRIQNFSKEEVNEIVYSSIKFLEGITSQKIFAFRAGGWCIQPFEKLNLPFAMNGVWLDSTVYHKGFNKSSTHFYDFRKSPDLDSWNFNNDPVIADNNGAFMELPIASFVFSPIFFWRLIFIKKFFHEKFLAAGDGNALSKGRSQLLRMILLPTRSVVSIDGYKSSVISSAFNKFLSTGKNNFVVIGHPKAMSSFSFNKLDSFITTAISQGHHIASIRGVFGGKNNISIKDLIE